MNRTILIVICDFLLVSLLAFSTVDINKIADEGVERQVQTEILTNQVSPEAGRDLTAVMRTALEDERKSRDLLMGELERARQSVTDRERQVRGFQQELQAREGQVRQLADAQTNLQNQYLSAQTNIQQLSNRLNVSTTEALVSREKLAALEAEIKRRAEEAAAMQQRLAALAKSNEAVAAERQQLAGKLQVAEVEKRHATEQVAKMVEQVRVEREEKAKLADNVKALASQSSELVKEVRENRPIAPNTIFNEFVANRVQARVVASRSALIDASRRRETESVLVASGTNTYAMCHVADTPFALTTPGTDWESISGALARGPVQVPLKAISFHLREPRLVFFPLSPEEVKQLGSKVYPLSADPFKFQDAVLVGTREPYYGECRFQIDVTTPEYLLLDNSFIRGLFGKFNPSRGDLVFSRTGELLGVMVNGSYCFMIKNFDSGATLQFGADVRRQQTGNLLSLLGSRVYGQPAKLQ